jgi:membrane fusion protein (multidrug efflux system)
MRVGEVADLSLTKPAQFLQFDHVRPPPPPSARENPALHALTEIGLKAPACLFSCVALLALAGCAGSEPAPERAAQSGADAPAPAAELVETQPVELGTLPTAIEASGSVQARRVSGVGPEVSGRLVEVFVDVGDAVESGSPLFQIDRVPYEMALAEARAGLALARAERDNALQERERVEKLVEQRAVSQRRRDEQTTAAAVAVARVAQMEARVARAETNLERTLVRAPYAGSIVERRAHEGEMAGPGPVVVLQESGALVVVLNIPEATPVPVRAGSLVRLYVEGLSAPLETQVDRVSERVDPDTRTYEVRAPVHDSSGTVKAGSYGRAEILPTPGPPRAIVHRSALLMRDGRSYVFRAEGDTARRVHVSIGAMTSDRVEILSGVEVGDRVVRGEAVGRLADGDLIRTTPEEAPATAGQGPAAAAQRAGKAEGRAGSRQGRRPRSEPARPKAAQRAGKAEGRAASRQGRRPRSEPQASGGGPPQDRRAEAGPRRTGERRRAPASPDSAS